MNVGTEKIYGSTGAPACTLAHTRTFERSYEPIQSYRNVIHQTIVPNATRRKNAGEILPVTPYEAEHVTRQRMGMNGTAYQVGSTCPRDQERRFNDYYDMPPALESIPTEWLASIPAPGTVDIDGAVNQAIARASAGLMSLPVTVGEARETFRMVLNCFTRFKDFWLISIEEYRRLQRRQDRRHSTALRAAGAMTDDTLDWVSQWWLSVRYGWRPFLAEMQTYYEHWNAVVSENSRQNGTAIVGLPDVTRTEDRLSDNGVWRTHHALKLQATTTCRGFALCGVNSPTIAKFGLNPAMAAWELVTLSFMIDWFFDFGSLLATYTVPFSGYSLLSSGATVRQTITYEVSEIREFYGYSWAGTTSAAVCRSEITRIIRTPSSGGGLPPFNFNLTPVQMADFVLVARQIMGARFVP